MSKACPIMNRLAAFGLTASNAGQLARFYVEAFGAHLIAMEHLSDASFMRLMGDNSAATQVTLSLGGSIIELLAFDQPGKPYPKRASASDPIFQHFAIVVTDMDGAYQRLLDTPGWTPISQCGPERLPASSGGVTAFKFRDPDGHPLELLAFPDTSKTAWKSAGSGLFLGIDHSAITVSDCQRSIAFYHDLGFRMLYHTLNRGPRQQRLDGLEATQVEVTALAVSEQPPHLELLHYPSSRPGKAISRSNDVAATRLIFEASNLFSDEGRAIEQKSIMDPDGHHLILTTPTAFKRLYGAPAKANSNVLVQLE